MRIRLSGFSPLRKEATATLNLLCHVTFDYRKTHTSYLRRVRLLSLPPFGKSMLNHPRQLGDLLPHLENIIYRCFYLFAIVTSMWPHFYSWVHFTPQFIYLRHFYETPLFKTISPGVVRSPWTNDCKYMKQAPGVILSSHGGHFRSIRA